MTHTAAGRGVAMSRASGDGRAPDRSSFAEGRPTAGIIPDTETTRAPYPGREDNGEEDDYSELLRAAWEQLEPQVRSQKALLATPSIKGSVQVITPQYHRRDTPWLAICGTTASVAC